MTAICLSVSMHANTDHYRVEPMVYSGSVSPERWTLAIIFPEKLPKNAKYLSHQ